MACGQMSGWRAGSFAMQTDFAWWPSGRQLPTSTRIVCFSQCLGPLIFADRCWSLIALKPFTFPAVFFGFEMETAENFPIFHWQHGIPSLTWMDVTSPALIDAGLGCTGSSHPWGKVRTNRGAGTRWTACCLFGRNGRNGRNSDFDQTWTG